MASRIEQLEIEISRREDELSKLRSELAAEQLASESSRENWKWPLQQHEYERYSRQMIVPNFGVEGEKDVLAVYLVGNGPTNTYCRSITTAKSQGALCWCRWTRMPGSSISCRRRCWYIGSHRW